MNREHDIIVYATDDIRCMLADSRRFDNVSGATAFRHEDKKLGWTNAGYFSFEREGKLYFVTVQSAE